MARRRGEFSELRWYFIDGEKRMLSIRSMNFKMSRVSSNSRVMPIKNKEKFVMNAK